jgi:LPXTG-site transpeptidase (sortase) family protein
MSTQTAGKLLKTAAILLIGYLLLSRAFHSYAGSLAAAGYEEETESRTSAYREEQLARASRFNERLEEAGGLAAFPDWNDTIEKEMAADSDRTSGKETGNSSGIAEEKEELLREYESLLNTGRDGVMGVLEVPAIGLRLPIYHGANDQTMQKGCGHLAGTSLPVGGAGTHTVLFSHRGLPGNQLFTDLDHLKKGDTFSISVLGKRQVYRVETIRTVLPEAVETLTIQKEKDLATLVTCTPYGVNTHRLLVTGVRTKADAPAKRVKRSMPEKTCTALLRPSVLYSAATADVLLSLLWLWKIWFRPFRRSSRSFRGRRKRMRVKQEVFTRICAAGNRRRNGDCYEV